MANHQREVLGRFLCALGEMKQLPQPSGDRYTCFGCCKPHCHVFWNVDEVCRYCFTMTHQSGDWTDDALESLAKRR